MTGPTSRRRTTMTVQTTQRSISARAADVFLSDYFVFYMSVAFIIILAPFLPILVAPAASLLTS